MRSRTRGLSALAQRALLVWLALLALCLGCRPGGPAASRSGPARRIVSLSPSTTEALFALGEGGRVVGRSRYCNYPPEALHVPAVGGFIDASLEAIVGLKPDLVVGAQGPAGRSVVDQLSALGIASYFPRTESVPEIEAMIEGLGQRTGAAASAEVLLGEMRRKRDAIGRAVAGRPKPKVLLVFGFGPVVVAGPDGFPNEMLSLSGGRNVVERGGAYPTVNLERLLALDPDVIIDATYPESDAAGMDKDDPTWRELSAVKKGKVVVLRDEALLRPGPRVVEGLAVLARALHPEANVP
jgi:iron complex transport system substrate-binding protein